jgi:hypothetical protein
MVAPDLTGCQDAICRSVGARYAQGVAGDRGGRATGAHLKGMHSYELHAWQDAIAIAALLDEWVGAARARNIYDRIDGRRCGSTKMRWKTRSRIS